MMDGDGQNTLNKYMRLLKNKKHTILKRSE